MTLIITEASLTAEADNLVMFDPGDDSPLPQSSATSVSAYASALKTFLECSFDAALNRSALR